MAAIPKISNHSNTGNEIIYKTILILYSSVYKFIYCQDTCKTGSVYFVVKTAFGTDAERKRQTAKKILCPTNFMTELPKGRKPF